MGLKFEIVMVIGVKTLEDLGLQYTIDYLFFYFYIKIVLLTKRKGKVGFFFLSIPCVYM